MSHDLQFQVQGGPPMATEPTIQGEMDHLPDRSVPVQQQQGQDDSGGGGGLAYIQEKLAQSSHPMVIIFHLLFKGAALFLYLFGGWFLPKKGAEAGAHFITLTVACILLLAADFWVVKNVTGRLLVGLRWWNQVQDDETKWIFESAEDKAVNTFDRSVFWTVLYATPVVWLVMLIFCVLRLNLSWLLIVVMALALSCANVYGYYKCSKDQKTRLNEMMAQGAQQGAMAMMRGNMMSMLTGSGGGNRGVV